VTVVAGKLLLPMQDDLEQIIKNDLKSIAWVQYMVSFAAVPVLAHALQYREHRH
jgi:hypothetical protein